MAFPLTPKQPKLLGSSSQPQFSGGPFAQFMDPNGQGGQPQQRAPQPMFNPQQQAAHDQALRGTLQDPNLHRFVQSPWGRPGQLMDWTQGQQQQAAAGGAGWQATGGMTGQVGQGNYIGAAGGAHANGGGGHQLGVPMGAGHGGAAGGGGMGGMGGGFGGGGIGGVQNGQVGQQLSQYQNQANQSNANRYNQLLQMAGNLSNSQMSREQQRQDFELGRIDQHAISAGIGNTTVLPTLERGAIDQSAIRQNEISDQGTRAAMGIVERRTDQQPDYGLLASLAGRPGASGGSFGFSGGPQMGGGGGGGGHQNGLASIFDNGNGLPQVNPMLDSGNTSSGVNAISTGTGGPSGPAGKQALIDQLVAMMGSNMPSLGGQMSGPQNTPTYDAQGNPVDPNTGQPIYSRVT